MPKVLVDSTPVTLEVSDLSTFEKCCQAITNILLEKQRAIIRCKLDGKLVEDPRNSQEDFAKSAVLEIETLPLKEALFTMIQQQILETKRLEESAEKLVTDCLLAEPQEIVTQWTDICETTKSRLNFIPMLAPILNEQLLEKKVEPLLAELSDLMQSAGASFSTADVVTFSDVIENKYISWLKKLREILQSAQKEVEQYKS